MVRDGDDVFRYWIMVEKKSQGCYRPHIICSDMDQF